MTLYYLELKLNTSSIVSLIDASTIKFAVHKEFYNVINFYIFLIIIFLLTYCKVTMHFKQVQGCILLRKIF